MARTQTDDKLEAVNTAAQNDPAEMMAQLLQMQEQIRQQMAELEKKKAEATQAKKPVVSDAWERKRTVFLPRAMGREQKFLLVGVNGRRYQVPRGKPVEVPEPLAERIDIMLKAEERAIADRNHWDAEAEETSAVLKRVL